MKNIKKKMLLKIIGMLLLIQGTALFPCIFVSLVYDKHSTVNHISLISFIYLLIGAVILRYVRSYKIKLKPQESFFIATFCWVFCSLLGALPFYFGGEGYTFVQSFFESTAGFTTTGCTSVDVETVPRGLIFWHAIMNWLGGMGILVLVVSVLPALGIGGQSMASTETTGPSLERTGFSFSSTGRYLYMTYLFFTLVLFLLLAVSPLSLYDAFINACSCISTAGLFITSENAAIMSMPYIKIVVLGFTVLASLNFAFYHQLAKKIKPTPFIRAEIKGFFSIIVIASLAVFALLVKNGTRSDLLGMLSESFTQVISFISTSGFVFTDYSDWPVSVQIILFILLLIGGCSMSTSGSLKVMRFLVYIKMIGRGIFRQIHPNSVRAIKIEGKAVPADKAGEITAHLLLFFMVLFFSFLVISLNNMDMTTTITSVIGIFTNTGTAIGGPGASGCFGMFNSFSLLYMSFLMIVGRLEMFAVIILFTGSFRRINSSI